MEKDTNLVLIGGGHSHAIALNLLGKNRPKNTQIILISNVVKTPYSGMLPGYLAGFYSYDEAHINLEKLAAFAGAKLLVDRAVGLDLNDNKVICENLDSVSFDVLSLDIGSTPTTVSVPGAKEYAIAIKPVPEFLEYWHELLNTANDSLNIAIVGGGAGGVELALNIQFPLAKKVNNLKIHIFDRGERLLANSNRSVSQILKKICLKRGIELHLSQSVTEVKSDKVICQSRLSVPCDRVFWVTQASAPNWIKTSGLTSDDRGFILVKDTLQSLSHPHIFAAGDIATMQNYPRPKAGVFAVRQGRPLYENLVRILANQEPKSYIPQQKYLSLIGTGDKNAIASWGSFAWKSPLLWLWKDSLDRSFMNRFN